MFDQKEIAALSTPTAKYPVHVRMFFSEGVIVEFCGIDTHTAMRHARLIADRYADMYGEITRLEREFFGRVGNRDWVMP